MPSPIPLVVNPAAGGGRALHRAHALEARLLARGAAVRVRLTSSPGHARALAAEYAAAGAPRLVACGGDGTLHEVAAGLAGSGTALAVLPAGRGNDFAAALGLARDVDAVARVTLEGRPAHVDLGELDGRPFCTVAGTGFDAEVARHVARGAHRGAGRWAYLVGALRRIMTYPAPRLRLEGDFGVREGRYLLAAFANTSRYGAGIRIAPGARADDGLLDCILVADLPRLTALRVLPSTYTGGHLRRPEVEVLRTAALRVEADRPVPLVADGEVLGELPAMVRVRPRALAVLTPVY
jgi:diacylglycerol kinase (ATP)